MLKQNIQWCYIIVVDHCLTIAIDLQLTYKYTLKMYILVKTINSNKMFG